MQRNIPYAYCLLSLIALWLSFTFLPILIFVALTPILWFYLYADLADIKKLMAVGVTFILSFGAISTYKAIPVPRSALYGVVFTIPFLAYSFTNRIIPNRLGLLTLALYICSIEYLSIRFIPEYSAFLLGGTLDSFPDIHRWSTSTGIIGVSAWIMVSNLWVTRIFSPHRSGSTGSKMVLLIYPAIVISIPALISIFVIPNQDSMTIAELQQLLESGFDESAPMEKFGRTCAWVSVFILIYALVQLRIKKK